MASGVNLDDTMSEVEAIRMVKYYFSQNDIDRMLTGRLSGVSVRICKNTSVTLSRLRTEDARLLFTVWNVNKYPIRFEMTRKEVG